MVDVRGFHDADADYVTPQPQQAAELAQIADWRAMVRTAATTGPAWTGLIDGRVIGCAGISIRWKGRAHIWCVLAGDIPPCAWIGIHQAVRRRLDQLHHLGIWRIEAETAHGFAPGIRWLEMLGFEREGLARGFGPDGRDFIRFARVHL